MKLGMSSYSLIGAMRTGEMTILDVIQWTADHGGEHIEIVPIGFTLDDNPGLVEDIVNKADEVGIDISNYAIGANFLAESEAALAAEIGRVKKEVDVANQLGVKLMRHDIAYRPPSDISIRNFEQDLPQLVDACREIADYALQYGITTSIENHGFHVQASDRVQRVIELVDRPNFRTTLDTGNFLCVDENPITAVQKNLPYASMVHMKDFYVRPGHSYDPGEGWFRSAGGAYLRGAVTGQGDIDMEEIIRLVKHSGYDGYISIEFEGMEESKTGAKISLDNVRRLWDGIE